MFQILFLIAACLFYSTFLMIFAHTSLKELDSLVKNFWLMLGGFSVSVVAMLIMESPAFPDNTKDLMFCLCHIASFAACTLLIVGASKYITAVNCVIVCSLEVPLMLLIQTLFLNSFGKEVASSLQIVGAIIVFLAVVSRPLCEIYVFRKRGEEEQ